MAKLIRPKRFVFSLKNKLKPKRFGSRFKTDTRKKSLQHMLSANCRGGKNPQNSKGKFMFLENVAGQPSRGKGGWSPGLYGKERGGGEGSLGHPLPGGGGQEGPGPPSQPHPFIVI